MDNIPSELVQAGGEAMIYMLLIICNKTWPTGEWPTLWTQPMIVTLPKKGNLQLCQNYCTISLISHPSKIMLRILLNRLKPQAEGIIKEEQAGFRAGRSTTEQIFNLRMLCEKYLEHQQSLYHVFVDFKKAFDRVLHAALRVTMRLYNINDNLIRTTECLYNKATSEVYHYNNNWSAPRMSAFPHPLQHLRRENNGWRTWRSWRNSQYWRQDNYKLTFCRRHWRPSWTKACLFVCWLLIVPATCECISGTDLHRQFYVLPHWDRRCRSNFPSHPVTVYWHRADQSQCWPYNARRLAG